MEGWLQIPSAHGEIHRVIANKIQGFMAQVRREDRCLCYRRYVSAVGKVNPCTRPSRPITFSEWVVVLAARFEARRAVAVSPSAADCHQRGECRCLHCRAVV